ncbi:PepSY-associated TM helix domain-containing protein [Edaphobacter albus]|uniref:PepSY-associated TM helix domain-containing protein n=1 Tax=Edaphobacter sp. 4G125 TaxID=2763071 RepID=UPI00164474A2|nr:PepSY-associated TM helix domain-containing protein [Edaphobacter sp. 4G125]QNI36289.1 PepSY domain-containing protein [Edaphobacter sp. 4G125]
MSFVHDAVHHPRKLWLRRTLFQIHLWAGVLLSLYLIVIALTGAILVFEDELTSATLPAAFHPYDSAETAPVTKVVNDFRAKFPDAKIEYLALPTRSVPAFQVRGVDAQKHEFNVMGDPVTGILEPASRNWLNVVHDLHIYLLLGEEHGVQVNGIGAAILLLLAATGLALWWPGIRIWTRGLGVSFRHSWRRINYDAHSAIGFWTLALVTWWAFSGVYFAWYRQVGAAVNMVTPLKNMIPPALPEIASQPTGVPRATLVQLIEIAGKVSPAGHLAGLTNATLDGPTVMALMDRGKPGDFSHRDVITLDAASGRVLTIWHYGQNQSLGDWILWAMHPLHFGTLWGRPIKVLWCLFGVSLAVLSATGVLMYWNRYLSKRWHALTPSASERHEDSIPAA